MHFFGPSRAELVKIQVVCDLTDLYEPIKYVKMQAVGDLPTLYEASSCIFSTVRSQVLCENAIMLVIDLLILYESNLCTFFGHHGLTMCNLFVMLVVTFTHSPFCIL